MSSFEITRPEDPDLKRNAETGLWEGRYWGQKTGPDSALRRRDGKSAGNGNYVDSSEFQFADHAYRVKRDDGSITYYSEPYQLISDDFTDLAWLAGNGWRVYVSDGPNRHSDKALLVEITKA